ncbi:MAG: PorT family protein [Rikenellaceae bacterium]|nr:PorT family protein [Rikenellaceae bacterium]
MRISYLLSLTSVLVILSSGVSTARHNGSGPDLRFRAGVNIGATTPVPIPSALDITGYNPHFNPTLGADFSWFFDDNWGLGAGLTLDWKGMKVHTRITDVHLTIDVPSVGTLTGYVTGRNTTKVNTLYLVQPIYAVYRFNRKWQVRAGIYMAEALHRKFSGSVSDVLISVESPLPQEREISYATLDYSSHARKFDLGLLAGGEFRMNRHVGFYTDLTWGLRPYFSGKVPIRFALRNIYVSVGATFRI